LKKKKDTLNYGEFATIKCKRENNIRFLEELQNSVNDINLAIKGKKKLKPMEEFLNEL